MLALAIFAVTYLAVAAGRFPWLSLDRPSAALLGAVFMVAGRVLSPAQAAAAINGDTLGLLLGMMIVSAYLGEVNSSDGRAIASCAPWQGRGRCCGRSSSRPGFCLPCSSTTRCV